MRIARHLGQAGLLNRRALLCAGAVSVGLAVPASLRAAARPQAQPYRWAPVPYGGGGYVDGFLYHPAEKDLLYARTDVGGLYRFDANSRAWRPLLDHLAHGEADYMGVLSMAVDRAHPERLYAACGLYLPDWAHKGAILRSADRGQTWQVSALPIHVGGNADGRGSGERLAVDPRNPDRVYYGSNQDGLWRSVDGARTFARVAAFPAQACSLVLFEPGGGALYVGVADADGGLRVSRDGGETFQPVEGLPAQVPQHAVIAADGTLFLTMARGEPGHPAVNPSYAVRGGVWKRDPRSGKWRDISPLKTDDTARFGYSGVDVGPDGLLVVSTLDRWWPHDELFASRDGGDHWTAMSGQMRFEVADYPWLAETNADRKIGSWLSDLRINPFRADEMIYGHGGGLWMSQNLSALDSGQPIRFEAVLRDFEEGAVSQLASPTGGATLLATELDTAGAAWDDLTHSPKIGLFRPNTGSDLSVDYAGLKPGLLVRTATNGPHHGFRSSDSGGTWAPLAAPSALDDPTRSDINPGLIAISAGGTSLLWVTEKQGAFWSRDAGRSWHASDNWPASDTMLMPLSDKAVDGVFYVHDRSGGRILISVDGGASFKPIALGLPALAAWERAQLGVVPGRMRDLWLALPSLLLHSGDAGTAFKPVKAVSAAWAIGFGAAATPGGYPAIFLYGIVSGTEGLWRSDDEAVSWQRINDAAHQYGDMTFITGDPLEHGTVYIAPHGRGILVGHPQN